MTLADSRIPVRISDFQLQQTESEFQLFKADENTAIYINQGAAIIWQLCDGERSVGKIKKMLSDAYPQSKSAVTTDVDDALALLVKHKALK